MLMKRAHTRSGRASLAPLAGLISAVALAAALAAGAASGQVLSSNPYSAPPDPAVERLQSRVDALESDLRKMTGANEQLTYQLNNTKKEAADANAGRLQLQKDVEALTARVTALEALAHGDVNAQTNAAQGPAEATVNLNSGLSNNGGNGGGNGGLAPAASAAARDLSQLPQDEPGMLKEARNYLLAGDYPTAQAAFSKYLASYPKSDSADEAQYLLGESLLYQNSYADAADAYGKLLSSYPKSDRGPEALVKLARSMRLLNKKSEACKALGLMPTRFPKASNAAKTLAANEKQKAGC